MIAPYPDEKSTDLQFILPYIPKDIHQYIEPFGGMYGVFFGLNLSHYTHCRFIYNDKQWLNYNLFRHLTYNPFIQKIATIRVNSDLFNWIKSHIFADNNFNELEYAIYYAILLYCSSDVNNLAGSEYQMDNMQIFYHRLLDRKKWLDRIDDINNLDYHDILTKYDSINSFFYLDPPGEIDINHLYEKVSNLRGKWLISTKNDLKDKFEDDKKVEYSTLMGKRFLIMNYEI